jgi:2-polyprenyl-6-methoxyphenol hydroxylase-like FAD-dependent oxidoreductase/ribosome-associated toxin RatA of RatAB toxin-antitoxin module
MDTDVIIVGAGPVGLMLAGELRLGGAEVTVFERRAARGRESRGVGFTARATEVFHQRGLLARFENAETSRLGHFGGIPMDFGVLEGSHFGVRAVPQYKIEEMLENWALEHGVAVRWGHDVVGLRDTGDGVVAIADGPGGRREYSAAYLVGCDGGRSTIRHLGGFDFPGSDATREMYLADVTDCDIKARHIGERRPNGMIMSGQMEDGIHRIIVCENGISPRENRDVTFAEVADAWQRLTGESIHHGRALWVSSFTDATRQVTQYRRGRVLLAGDSAHIHLPAGGQGLSVGVQDAVNLGWKLAATVNGWAPSGLLDSYHDERHPVGARVLRNTRAQGTLNLSGKEIEPLRTVMTELIAVPAAARHLSGMVSGLDIRYDVGGGGHPLLGARMPDREIDLRGGGRTRIADLLHPARGVILSAGDSAELSRIAAGWSDHVDLVMASAFPSGPEDAGAATVSVLIRPDGHVAWAAPADGQAGTDLQAALRRWFGAAVRKAEHAVTINAGAQRVYELIADVESWPEMFPPTVYAERVAEDDSSERIRIWATANGTAKTWTSRRQLDAGRMSIAFRQERSAPPVGGMGGTWLIERITDSQCRARLRHDYFAASDDPADLDRITLAVETNSTAELGALKDRAELIGPEGLITFDDTVEVDGSPKDVYDFLNEAQLWQERLPHVARVSLDEETSGLQILEMDTRGPDNTVHTTRSVRVCQPHSSIIYKQIVLPPLVTLHTGRWLIEERDGGGVSVTSRHTVRINTARVAEVLGPDADVAAAQEVVMRSLSANSLATLSLAKAYAEQAGHRRAAS